MAVGFLSRSSCKLAEEAQWRTHTHKGSSTLDIMGRLVFPLCDVELCDSRLVYLNERCRDWQFSAVKTHRLPPNMADLKYTHDWIFYILGGEVKVGRIIKCCQLSAAVMADSDITATRQLEGNKKWNPTLISSCWVPLAGIRTRLRLSALCVLCGVLYIHKHNYSDRQAHKKYKWHTDYTAWRRYFQVHFSCSFLSFVLNQAVPKRSIPTEVLLNLWPCTSCVHLQTHTTVHFQLCNCLCTQISNKTTKSFCFFSIMSAVS